MSTALQLAETKNNVPIVVVADDTDIAMMLSYHWRKELGELFFYQQRSNIWERQIKCMEPDQNEWNLIKMNEFFREVSTVMGDVWVEKEEVRKALMGFLSCTVEMVETVPTS